MEDLGRGVEEIGHQAVFVRLKMGYIRELERTLGTIRPDLAIAIDAAGFDPEIFDRLKIPCAAWFVDNPLYFLGRLAPSPWLMMFVWDRGYDDELARLGFDTTYHLPLATNPDRFSEKGPADGDPDRYRHRISFIGTLGSHLGESEEAGAMNPAVRKILDQVVEYVAARPGTRIREAIDNLFPAARDHFDSLPIEHWVSIETWVDHAAGKELRRRAMERLARFDLRVYGDDAWLNVLPRPELYAGKADYRTAVPFIYRHSIISLNLTRPQLRTAVNQRLFDVAAAEGFVLTDYRPDLEVLFDIEKEVASFRSLDEMEKLAEYYLNNPAERKSVAEKAHRRVLEQHTYRHRAERLIGLARERYGF